VRRGRSENRVPVSVILAWVLATVGLLFMHTVFRVREFPDQLTDANGMDYAQVARHVARGDGFTTSYIRPLSLTFAPRIEGHPELSYPPLHILLLALAFKIGGASATTASLVSTLFFVACGPLLYFLSSRAFGTRAALLAGGLYALNTKLLRRSIEGVETNLLAFWFLLLFIVALKFAEDARRSHLWTLLLGLVMAAVYLTKYVTVAVFLPVLVFVFYVAPRRRWLHAGLFAGVFLVAVSPWLIRNWAVVGDPFFSLRRYEIIMLTDTHPAQTLYRETFARPPSVLNFVFTHPRELVKKLEQWASAYYELVATLGGGFLSAFYLSGLLIRARRRGVEALKWVIYIGIAVTLISLCLMPPVERLAEAYVPLAIFLGSGFFLELLDRRLEGVESRRRAKYAWLACAALLLVYVFPLAVELGVGGPGSQRRSPTGDIIREVMAGKEPPQWIVTNVPWETAWEGDVPSVWVPQTLTEFREVRQKVGAPSAIFLTPLLRAQRSPDRLGLWFVWWAFATSGTALPVDDFYPHARLGKAKTFVVFRQGKPPPEAGFTVAKEIPAEGMPPALGRP